MYDSAAEAIFLCYLVDQEENDGDVRPYYASATLRKYMERHRPSYQLPAITPDASREEEGQVVEERPAAPAAAGARGGQRKDA